MGRQQHGGATGSRLAHQRVQHVAPVGVEPGVRLVEQPQLGSPREKRGDRRSTALPRRQLGHRHVPQTAVEGEPGHRLLSDAYVRAHRSRGKAQVVGDGQVLVERPGVTEEGHPATDRPPVTTQVMAQHLGLSRRDGDQARAGAEEGGLPRAVRPLEQHDLAARDVEVDACEGGKSAEERDRGAKADGGSHVKPFPKLSALPKVGPSKPGANVTRRRRCAS